MDRSRANSGMGRVARRRSIRPDESTRPRSIPTRLCRCFVLQDLRVPDRYRHADCPAGRTRETPPPLVLGWHDLCRLGAGRDRHFMSGGSEAFEDGTVDYLGIPAVEYGLDFLESIGMSTIHERVYCLTGWLLEQLLRCAIKTESASFGCTVRSRRRAAGTRLRSISTTQTVTLSTIRRSTLSPLSATFRCEPDVSATPVQARLHSVSQKTSSGDLFATQTTEWIARTSCLYQSGERRSGTHLLRPGIELCGHQRIRYLRAGIPGHTLVRGTADSRYGPRSNRHRRPRRRNMLFCVF